MYRACIFILLLMTSCSFFDNQDTLPMYFEIDEVSLQTGPGQGFNTHNIDAVSVFADGFSIGVYKLPANIPVLQTREELDLSIFGVIRNNGIAANPVQYPFYAPLDFNYEFMPGESRQLDLEFSYDDMAKVINVGDFESFNALALGFDNNPDIEFIRSAETEFGNFCGKITVDQNNLSFQKTTFSRILRSEVIQGSIFLEMDYRNEIPFSLGILLFREDGLIVPFYKLVLTEQEEWNKIYLELSNELADNQTAEFSVLVGTPPGNSNTGSVWVDNIKILHF